MLQRIVIGSRRRFGGIVLASVLATAAGCGEEKCVVQTTQYTASITTVGYYGPTTGQPVARFDLTQDFISHTPYAACAQGPLQDVGVVTLKVTSLSAVPLALKFDVQGLNKDSIPVWKQPMVLPRLDPGQTVDLGQVTVSPTHLDLGALVVLTQADVLP
jgi:hypothetical protein